MLYIETNTNDPTVNLAYEEFFLKKSHLDSDIFMLWQNEPTVVVGRHQNTVNEINAKYIEEKGINVVRRITGGGAVFHDLGTLCYSFIIRNVDVENISFDLFARSIAKALKKVNIDGEISGRNDITIDGHKFSGTAMALHKNSLLFHGTILYDTDLEALSQVLMVREDKIQSKGIKSVRSRVTNIKNYTGKAQEISFFKQALKDAVFEGIAYEEYTPTKSEMEEVLNLSAVRYKEWAWNYGMNKEANIHNVKRYTGGEVEVYLNVENSQIKTCKIYGDFLSMSSVSEVEDRLIDLRYESSCIEEKLGQLDLRKYFGDITLKELVECFMLN